MEKTINSLMNSEHERIDSLLKKFETLLKKDIENAKKILNWFKWSLEKHFFVEENAIFYAYESVVGEEVGVIFDLMKEHGEIIDLVKKMEENLNKGKEVSVVFLKERLSNHSKFEDEVFYPRLDEELEIGKKQEVIEKINELVRS